MDEIIAKFEKLSTLSKDKGSLSKDKDALSKDKGSLSKDKESSDTMSLLMEKIKAINIINPEQEWMRLTGNYFKLRHLRGIKNKDPVLFLLFMEKLDTLNKYYLDNINLNYNAYDMASIRDIIKIISETLNKSVMSNNPDEKLDYILIAYSNINLLIDDLDSAKVIKKRKR